MGLGFARFAESLWFGKKKCYHSSSVMYRMPSSSSHVLGSTSHKLLPPVTLSELQVLWQGLNAQYFDGRLPAIDIQWSARLTSSVGMFVSQTGPRSSFLSVQERHGSARKIRLSLPLLMGKPHSEIRGTLAHEMIHQWQYDVRKRRPSHGEDFYQKMAMMNRDGLGITMYHSLTQEVEAFTRYEWRCQSCGQGYRRQRRTISPARHRCSECLGSLKEVRLLPKELSAVRVRGGGHSDVRGDRKEGSASPLQLSFAF